MTPNPRDAIDVPLIELSEARYRRPSGPWQSRKFWQITGNGNSDPVEVRWGRIGVKGQAQTASVLDAISRATDKIIKGYTVDSDKAERARADTISRSSRAANPATAGSLAERLAGVRWKALRSDDELITTAAALGWVSLDLDALPAGHRAFVGKSNEVWALRLEPLAYGSVSCGGAS